MGVAIRCTYKWTQMKIVCVFRKWERTVVSERGGGRDVKREYHINIGAVNASQRTNHFPSMRFYQNKIVCFVQYFVWIWFWNILNANTNCFSIGMPRKKTDWTFSWWHSSRLIRIVFFFRIHFPTSSPHRKFAVMLKSEWPKREK